MSVAAQLEIGMLLVPTAMRSERDSSQSDESASLEPDVPECKSYHFELWLKRVMHGMLKTDAAGS